MTEVGDTTGRQVGDRIEIVDDGVVEGIVVG